MREPVMYVGDLRADHPHRAKIAEFLGEMDQTDGEVYNTNFRAWRESFTYPVYQYVNIRAVCFGSLTYTDYQDTSYAVFGCKPHIYKGGIELFEFFTNRDGPFAEIIKAAEVEIVTTKHNGYEFRGKKRKSLVINKLDVPARDLIAFLMHIRFCHEHLSTIEVYEKLRKAGLEIEDAFPLATQIQKFDAEGYMIKGPPIGHGPIDPTRPINFDRLRQPFKLTEGIPLFCDGGPYSKERGPDKYTIYELWHGRGKLRNEHFSRVKPSYEHRDSYTYTTMKLYKLRDIIKVWEERKEDIKKGAI